MLTTTDWVILCSTLGSCAQLAALWHIATCPRLERRGVERWLAIVIGVPLLGALLWFYQRVIEALGARQLERMWSGYGAEPRD